MICAPEAGAALLVDERGSVSTVPLPELTERELTARVESYLGAYRERSTARAAWSRRLEETGRWLWRAVMEPLLTNIGEAERAILIPCGVLGLLPLHAAWTTDPSMPTGRRFAIDTSAMTYAPSAQAMLSIDEVTLGRTISGAVVVEDPPRADRPRLPYAAQEAHAVLDRVPSATHLLVDADTRAVLDVLGEQPVFHFAGHAGANVEHPLDSALWLAGDDALTIGQLMDQRLVGIRLAVLSACETAIPAQQVPDEALGIPSVLIQAGAAASVGSLWTVADASTAVVMSRFYELMINKQESPATALRHAQQWVRDSTHRELADAYPDWFARDMVTLSPSARELWETARPYAHPQHWAAFVYVGA